MKKNKVIKESKNEEEIIGRNSKDLNSTISKEYEKYKLDIPDENSEPCLYRKKVKVRGAWDKGNKFINPKSGNIELMMHQKFLSQFAKKFLYSSRRYRGVLLYHGMGSGKTCSSIAMTKWFENERPIVFLSPAGLKENFIQELKKCGSDNYRIPSNLSKEERDKANKKVDKEILKKYFFVSYDSPRADFALNEIPGGLDNKVLIVEESHNLVSMIMNESKKGTVIYNMIMEANNLKVIFLTGTPIINDPFEIAITVNLLSGYIYPDNSENAGESIVNPGEYFSKKNRKRITLFNNTDDFRRYFIDDKDMENIKLKNPMMFKRRIQGLISYYRGVQPEKKVLPRVRYHLEKLEMSDYQYTLYDKVRELERDFEKQGASKFKKSGKKGRASLDMLSMFSRARGQSSKSGTPSLFRAFSRQFSNFVFPIDIPRPLPRGQNVSFIDEDKNKRKMKIDDIESNDLAEDFGKTTKDYKKSIIRTVNKLDNDSIKYLKTNLKKYSVKMHKMMSHIDESNGPVYIYSQFRDAEGVGVFSKVLEANGYLPYGYGDDNYTGTIMKPLPHSKDSITGKMWANISPKEKRNFKPLTYIVWGGFGTNVERKRYLYNLFNSDENKNGEIIKAFLTTKSGTEGISLMNIRQVHLMEPYWNTILSKQASGRAIRLCSHITLPVRDRVVDVYEYVTTHDTKKSADRDLEGNQLSTDQAVYRISQSKDRIINSVQKAIIEAAIDCNLNKSHNGLDESIKCMDFISDTNKSFVVDINEEKVDQDYYSEVQNVMMSLVPISLNKENYRINKQDKVKLIALKAKPKDYEGIIIPLYHQTKNIQEKIITVANGKILIRTV